MFTGQSNPQEFYQSYMSSVCSVQGVGNILELAQCDDIAEHFRGLSLRRHSRLFQCLPAKLRQDLEDRQEFVQLNARIEELNRKIRASGTSEEECQKLEGEQHSCYLQKQKLEAQELDDWQNSSLKSINQVQLRRRMSTV